MSLEQTYIMIKPDGVQRGLIGEVIKRFEAKGYYLRALKLQNVEQAHAEEHYVDLKSKPFYGGLVKYICRSAAVLDWIGSPAVSAPFYTKLLGSRLTKGGHLQRARRGDGLGGQVGRLHRPQNYWRNQPTGIRAGHDPWRLLY